MAQKTQLEMNVQQGQTMVSIVVEGTIYVANTTAANIKEPYNINGDIITLEEGCGLETTVFPCNGTLILYTTDEDQLQDDNGNVFMELVGSEPNDIYDSFFGTRPPHVFE